jgi:copper homeostasis protein
MFQLEVCAFNIQSAIIAEEVGAARVELCDNPVEGGTTPSYGCIRETRERITILLYPIIRPRAGNYFYDEEEFNIMKRDITVCKELECDGISIGIQTKDGRIDKERMKRFVELAYPMGVTSNRVFDNVRDPYQALEDLIECGCERVLTSGLQSAAPDGIPLLAKLVEQSAGRIIIMPGAGVRSQNVERLLIEAKVNEVHTSARINRNFDGVYGNSAVSDTGNVVIADKEELDRIVAILNRYNLEEEE